MMLKDLLSENFGKTKTEIIFWWTLKTPIAI